MRKIFFLSALVISTMSMAQGSLVNWHDVSAVDNQGIKNGLNFVGYSSYENVQVNETGDLFVSANINSVGRDPHATIFEASVEAVPGKVNAANSVPAPMFVKANAAGDVQWIVAATDANYKSFATLPTADGGLLVALVGHQAIVDVLGMGLHDGAASDKVVHQLAKEQYGLLVKIASDGKPSILATIKQAAEGKTDGIQVRKIVTDGTYYYVLANLKSKVAIGTVEVEPAHTGGSLAVLKFDAAGALQGTIQTAGTAITASTADLKYADNKLYLTCSLKGAANGTLSIGETSVTLDNANTNIVVFVANSDMTGDAVKIIPGQLANNKNLITTYATMPLDGKLYISGFYQGGIAGVPNNETGKNRAFVMSLDLATDAIVGVQLPAAGANGISSISADGLLSRGDSIYAYYYDWSATGERLFLQAMGKDCVLGSRLGLVQTGANTGTRGACLQGDNLVYTFYPMKGSTNKLSADESIEVKPVDMNCGVVVSQKIFDSATPVNEVREDAGAPRKQLNAGNVYVISGTEIYNILGQKVN